MVSIVLASHGAFAAGIKESGQMIFGPQDAVEAIIRHKLAGVESTEFDEFNAFAEAAKERALVILEEED